MDNTQQNKCENNLLNNTANAVNTPKVLGILGGLGPMATVYFYELLISHTSATCDQDHIDLIINSRATTPDRTAFIMGKSSESPFDIMHSDAQKLVTYGADVLAIPCNTAHYFFDKLNATTDVPILNMVEETVKTAKQQCDKVGILATTGTLHTNTYQRVLQNHNVDYAVPCKEHEEMLMDIIYGSIKQGQNADMQTFNIIVDGLKQQGCNGVILGCTELSIIKRNEGLGAFYIDSMEVLAKNAIETFGKTPIGF